MLQECSALLPQVSANDPYQRHETWLARPSQLCMIFISQDQNYAVYRSQMAFILMGLSRRI